MHWWQAALLGLVEGITEYLPVSSTGHLIIASDLMRLEEQAPKAVIDSFLVAVQGGAILAVVGLYWPRFVQMLRGLLGRDAAGRRLLINLVLAFIPAAIAGKLFHDRIEARLFSTGPVLAALALGGLYMIAIDYRVIRPRERAGQVGAAPGPGAKMVTDLTPRDALTIGVLQCVALWPGVSRSMMTITGGVLVGLDRTAAAEFSFLLGVPTLTAATLYSLYKDHAAASHGEHPGLFASLGTGPVVVGAAVAAVSAAMAVRGFVAFLGRRSLAPFGYYRLLLAGVLALLVWRGLVSVGDQEAGALPPDRALRHPSAP